VLVVVIAVASYALVTGLQPQKLTVLLAPVLDLYTLLVLSKMQWWISTAEEVDIYISPP
jgi:hypothetical protein